MNKVQFDFTGNHDEYIKFLEICYQNKIQVYVWHDRNRVYVQNADLLHDFDKFTDKTEDFASLIADYPTTSEFKELAICQLIPLTDEGADIISKLYPIRHHSPIGENPYVLMKYLDEKRIRQFKAAEITVVETPDIDFKLITGLV